MSPPRKSTNYKPGRGYDGDKGSNFAPDSGPSKQFDTDSNHADREPYNRNDNKSGDKFVESGSQWGPGSGRADHNNVCSDGDFGQLAGARDICPMFGRTATPIRMAKAGPTQAAAGPGRFAMELISRKLAAPKKSVTNNEVRQEECRRPLRERIGAANKGTPP
jgi:hypothetical protein